DHLGLEALEIDVEVVEDMVLDVARMVAQRLELREPRRGGRAPFHEVLLHMDERPLQLGIIERAPGVVLEAAAGGVLHQSVFDSPLGGTPVMPASPSATWRTAIGRTSRFSLPAMLSRQPRSPASRVPAPVAAMSAVFSLTILSEIAGYLTQNVPPKPQQISAPGNSASRRPSTVASSLRGCCLTPSSRRPEQES